MDGERLSEMRKDKGLNQQQLADILKIHKTTLSKYENNQTIPDSSIIKDISEFFGVSSDYFLGLTKKEKPLHSDEPEFIRYRNLSPLARKELNDFLDYFEKKYKLD